MVCNRLATVWLLSWAVAAASAAETPSAAPAALQELLARPVSPGALALLAEHAADPAVQERWAQALRDPRAPVRATAARLIHVADTRALAPALRDAFAAERDPDAADELARALLTLAGDGAVDSVFAAVAGSALRVDAAGTALARARGPAALSSLARLRDAGLGDTALALFLQTAARRKARALRPAAASAIRERDVELWTALLAATRAMDDAFDPGLLASAVREPALREATLWHLVLAGKDLARAEVVRAALDELRGEIEAPGAPAPPFAWELAQRALGRAAREDVAGVRRLAEEQRKVAALLRHEGAAERLTKAEREALGLGTIKFSDHRSLSDALPPRAVMRSLNALPSGLGDDLLQILGCGRAGRHKMAAADVTFLADGRPRNVRVFDRDLPAACRAAARTLLALDLADPAEIAAHGPVQTVTVVPDPKLLACQGQRAPVPQRACPEWDADCRLAAGGEIKEPRKTHNVNPRYPEDARRHRISGLVIVEAVVSPSGCISSVKLVQSAHARLDLEAMLAVHQWRYTPTLLDGVAVPVIMTVTVNFALAVS